MDRIYKYLREVSSQAGRVSPKRLFKKREKYEFYSNKFFSKGIFSALKLLKLATRPFAVRSI